MFRFTVMFRVFSVLLLGLIWALSPAGTRAAQAQPFFSAIFSPDTIGPGSTSTLTYTISNSGGNVTDLAFVNTLPASVTLASSANAQTTCAGPVAGFATLSAPNGGTTVTFSDGALAAGNSCTVSVDVTSSTIGTHTNTTGDLTSSAGNSGTATDDLEVVATLPSFSKAFAPSSITQNSISTLTYTIDNTANAANIGALDFSETLPTGMIIASPSNATTDCISALLQDTTLTAISGASNITLDANGNAFFAGAEVLAAGATCSVSLNVQGVGVGALTATSGDLLADSASAGASTATLTVTGDDLQLSKSFTNDPVVAGANVTLEYTVQNKDRNFSASSIAFSDDLNAALAGLTFDSLLSNTCGGSVSGVGTTSLSLSGGAIGAQSSCTLSASLSVPVGADGDFPSTSGAVTATVNGAAVTGSTASDSLAVQAVTQAAPELVLAFGDTVPGGVSSGSLMLTNRATTAATDVTAFVQIVGPLPFPTTVSFGANDCGGTVSLVSAGFDQRAIQLSGGTLAANGTTGDSCTANFDITVPSGVAPGVLSFTSQAPSATVGGTTATGAPASGTMTIGGGVTVDLEKSFDAANGQVGGTVGLTFSITNRAESAGNATNISFTDDLDAFSAGTVLTSVGANDCGVTPTGTSTISVSGITLAQGASCSIATTITLGTDTGDRTNTTSAPTAGLNGGTADVAGNTASASLNVNTFDPLTFTHDYVADPYLAGDTGTLRYTITNPNDTEDATGMFFTHNLSSVVTGFSATTPLPTNPCGTGSSLSGTTFLILVGGNLLAGESCTFDVPVIVPSGAADGTYSSATSNLSGAVGGASTTFDPSFSTLAVESAALRFSKAFASDDAFAGAAVGLVFDIENSSSSALTSLAFTDDLENDFLSGSTFLGQNSNTCGGTLSGQGTGNLAFTGGTLGAGVSCSISVNVQLPAGATAGDYTNTSSTVTASAGALAVTGDEATDDLTVFGAAAPTFSKSFDGPATATGSAQLSFTISNPSTTLALDNVEFNDDLGAMLSGAVASSLPATPCGAGSSLSGTSVLALSGGVIAPLGSCTFTVTVQIPAGAAAGSYTNTTSSLQRNRAAIAAPATANLTIDSPPSFSKAFTPASIAQGATSRLTFSVNNTSSGVAASSLAFVDNLPTGVTVAATPSVSSNCGGAVSATASSSSISLSGGAVGAGASCTIGVDVTSSTVGAAVNTTGDLTSSAGNSGTASATLTVTAAPAPAFSKAFGAATFEQGDSTSLTFTIDNTAASISATSLAFSDVLPTGMTVATPPNTSSTCGTVSAAAGSGSISLSGGTVGAGVSCTIAVDVTSSTLGAANNTSGALTSSAGSSGTASASVTITAAPVPGFTKAFTAGSIVQGDVDTLTFTIDNTALIGATNLSFSDTFPTDMVIAPTPNNSSTCTGGMGTFTAGAGSMSYAGGSVAAASSCTVSFDITSPTVGTVTNTSGALTSSLGTSSTASAGFTVTAAPAPSFTKAFSPSSIVQGDVSTLTFTIDNTSALVSATALDFSDPLPSGVTVAAAPNASSTCTGGTISAAAGAGTLGYSGGAVAQNATCTVSVDVTSATQGVAMNTTGNLTSSLGNSGTASASLSVTATPVPSFSKAFGSSTAAQGEVTTLTFSIDNSASLIAATTLDFSDTFPSGMTIAATPNASTTCSGGTIAATAGAGSTRYSGGSVGATATCTVSVDVIAVDVGNAVNVSGALTSSAGTSGTATDTLAVTAAAAPAFSKAFSPTSIEQGAISTLTFTIDNSAPLVAATALDFTDTFPTGMSVAATPNASTTCTGGTLTATAGAGLMSYTGGSIAATATCTVSVDVTAVDVGAAVNTSGALTSSQGSSGTASATLTVTAATAPAFSKAFSPASIVQGATSTLTYTIDNATALVEASALDFADSFPTGLTLASSPNASTTCTGGTLNATGGSSGFGYSGGTVALGSSCTVSVNVTSATVGAAPSTSGDLTSSLGNSGTASATLTVTGAPAPTFAKAFSPASVPSGGTSRLTYTINNGVALVPASSLAFAETFPAGIQIAPTPNASSSCGGTFLAPASSSRIDVSGGSVAAGGSCTVGVDVTATGLGPVATTSGDLTSSLGNSGTASATLTITAVTTGQVTITQLSDVDQDFGFTSPETLLNFTISTLSGGGSQGPITLAAGTYSVAQIRPAGFGNTSITCSDANSTGVSSSGALTLNVEAGESLICTFASVDSVTPTREAINDFLTGRINQILSNEPSNGRRINRLKRGFGGSRSVSFARGDLKSLLPVNFDLKSLGTGSYSISGSLAQAQAAVARHPLSLDGSETDTTRVDNHRFDVWFEASYTRFEGSQGSDGHFGIGYLGADYLVNKDLLIGFLVQYDDTEDRSASLNRVVSGEGWMVGPYMTARLSENLYFDGRVAVGRSNNFLDLDLNGTTGLANGRFNTSRWLVDASLVGDFEVGKWQMQPNLSVSYMEETQKAFVDSLNVLQPEQTVSQGQLRFGPNFSRRFQGQNGVSYEPSFTVDGIYNFGNDGATSATSTAGDTQGLRARVEAGLGIADRNGTRLNMNVHYDGIGLSNFEAYGISLKLEMKF